MWIISETEERISVSRTEGVQLKCSMKDRFNPKIAAFDKCYCGQVLRMNSFPPGINDKWDNHALKLFKRSYFTFQDHISKRLYSIMLSRQKINIQAWPVPG